MLHNSLNSAETVRQVWLDVLCVCEGWSGLSLMWNVEVGTPMGHNPEVTMLGEVQLLTQYCSNCAMERECVLSVSVCGGEGVGSFYL